MKSDDRPVDLPNATEPKRVQPLWFFDRDRRGSVTPANKSNVEHSRTPIIEKLENAAMFAARSLQGDPKAGTELEKIIGTGEAETEDLEQIIRTLAPASTLRAQPAVPKPAPHCR